MAPSDRANATVVRWDLQYDPMANPLHGYLLKVICMGRRELIYVGGVGGVLFGLYLAARVVAVQGFPPSNLTHATWLAVGLLIAIGLMVAGVGAIWDWHRQEHIQARRTAVIVQSPAMQEWLARDQPTSLRSAESLPITLAVRTHWGRYLTYLAIWSLLWMAILAIALSLNGSPMRGVSDFFARYYPAVALGVIPYAFIYFAVPHQLEVTPVGVLLRGRRGTEFVAFEGAQLFAITHGHRRNHPPIEYELSNTRFTVRWGRVRSRMPFALLDPITLMQPTIAFEEYDRRMETILSVIANKTGLPLYDLR